jgi:methyltransferase (TIGR00027 family)
MSEPLIRDVADTAFMIAAHRAIETRRSDALFRDPLADRLAGEHGHRIARGLHAMSAMTGWTVAIRTYIIDNYILRAVEQGADTVLNLGAGLDTRPYRLTLPESLQWIEVDYPGVIGLKDRELAQETPACRLQRVSLDLADRAARRRFFDELETRARNVVVLTEGVVVYLDEQEVATLADDLRAHACCRRWIVDYFSPRLQKYRDRPAIRHSMRNAPWRFRPADYFEFFAAHGWRPRETRSIPAEAQKLNRPPPLPALLRGWIWLAWLLAPQSKRDALEKTAGYVLFEPA